MVVNFSFKISKLMYSLFLVILFVSLLLTFKQSLISWFESSFVMKACKQ